MVNLSLRIFCTEEYFNNDGGEGDEEDCGADEESEGEGRPHPASQTNTALTLISVRPAVITEVVCTDYTRDPVRVPRSHS